MNAVTLEVLLHHYYRTNAIPRPTQAQREGMTLLCEEGLLDPRPTQMGEAAEQHYRISAKGRFHVDTLLNHPLPKEIQTFGYPE